MSEQQNFQNHTQRVPMFLVAAFALMATIVGAGVNLYQSMGDHQRLYSASLILALSVILFIIGLYARTFPLKAQDRAIRAEENLRHYVLTNKLLDSRLKPLQVVALRFASDAEFVELAKRAAEQNLSPDDIKKSIKSWRADTYRV